MASNKALVPEAKDALEQFKMEAAAEVGVNLKNGYNGELTSKQAGSIGGQMVKKMLPVRNPPKMAFSRVSRVDVGYARQVKYIAGITV